MEFDGAPMWRIGASKKRCVSDASGEFGPKTSPAGEERRKAQDLHNEAVAFVRRKR